GRAGRGPGRGRGGVVDLAHRRGLGMTTATVVPGPSKVRGYSTAWWGMAMLIATEAMVFGILLASYFFLRAAAKEWPLEGIDAPELTLALPFSFVLWASSIPMFWAEAGIRRGDQRRLRAGLLLSF